MVDCRNRTSSRRASGGLSFVGTFEAQRRDFGYFGACSNNRAGATKRVEACAGRSNIPGQGVDIDFRINHVVRYVRRADGQL